MEYMGNISLRLIGLLVTVGTLAASYFFIVKPVTDTTKNAFDSVSPAFQSLQDAQKDLNKIQKTSNSKGAQKTFQVQGQKLAACAQSAGQDVNKLNACVKKFGPK